MAAFIIAVFRVLVYLLFAVITIGGAWMGYTQAWQLGYQPWVGAIAGFILGFVNAVIVTGVMVILLDIQDSLRDLIALRQDDDPGEVHHHHHHESEEAGTGSTGETRDAS